MQCRSHSLGLILAEEMQMYSTVPVQAVKVIVLRPEKPCKLASFNANCHCWKRHALLVLEIPAGIR